MGKEIKGLISDVEKKEIRYEVRELTKEEEERDSEEARLDKERFVDKPKRRAEAKSNIAKAQSMSEVSLDDLRLALGVEQDE